MGLGGFYSLVVWSLLNGRVLQALESEGLCCLETGGDTGEPQLTLDPSLDSGRDWHIFSVKDQTTNISGFRGPTVSAATAHRAVLAQTHPDVNK